MPLDLSCRVTRRSALGALGAAGLAAAHPLSVARAQPPTFAQRTDDLTEEELARLLRLARVPSISIAMADRDRVTTRALGRTRADGSETATADTVYAAASLTKTVFSYVLLDLVREGALSLDRPLRELLPLPHPEDPHAGAITARRLLSHTSGWRNWRNSANQPLTSDFEPGTAWSYSGEGFFFLQRVVEHLTGRAIAEVMRQRLFEPLGMRRTSLVALADLEPFQATPHDFRGEPREWFGRTTLLELRRMMAARGASLEAARTEDVEQAMRVADPERPVLPNFSIVNAASSLLTTASDFGRFLQHLLTARQAGGAPAAVVELMMTPQIRCNEAIQWGLGVGLEEVDGRTALWQWGDNPGFKNYVFADLEGGAAMVVFTNGDRGARVYERVIRSLTGRDRPGFLWL